MKAGVTDGKGGLALRDIAMPEIDAYECLVRNETCAFCNSTDRHLVEGTFPGGGKYPAVLGHECMGVIERVGARVRFLKEGDRVLRAFALWPGECADGLHSLWGGFAEFGKIKDKQAMIEDGLLDAAAVPGIYAYQEVVPPDIDPGEAVLLTCQKEIWSSVEQFSSIEGLRFLVGGAGITACLFGLFLRMHGAAGVALAARRRGPLDFAMEQGAAGQTVLLADFAAVPADFDALIETTGSLTAASQLLSKVKHGGTMYSYAVYEGMGDDSLFDPFRKHHVFTRVGPREPLANEAVCDLLRRGKLQTAPFVTHRFPMADLEEAWRTVTEKRTLKTVVCF